VRLVCKFLSPIPGTLSEVDGNGEGGGTRGDVNRRSTSEIETTVCERPSVGVPCHTGKWIVDKSRPDEREHKSGSQPTAFGDGTNSNDRAEKGPELDDRLGRIPERRT